MIHTRARTEHTRSSIIKRSKKYFTDLLLAPPFPFPALCFWTCGRWTRRPLSHRLRSCGLARLMLHARPCIEHRGQIEDARSWRRSPLAHRHSATDVRLSRCARPNPHAPHVLPARPVLTAHCSLRLEHGQGHLGSTGYEVSSTQQVVGGGSMGGVTCISKTSSTPGRRTGSGGEGGAKQG